MDGLLNFISYLSRRILIISFLFSACITKADSWQVLFYMDSSDGLSDMAFKNITDMMRGKPHDTIQFLVQLHAYEDKGLRYAVTEHGLQFLQEVTLSMNCKQDLIDGASWAFGNSQADHTLLILSNHGWGILDPQWSEEKQKWEAGADSLSNLCVIKRFCNGLDLTKIHARHHKGYMFMAQPRTYLNNQDMLDAFGAIQSTALSGKKIDVVAFDTCMGAMLEVGYELAPYASYLLGVQSCALKDGFDYQNVMAVLNGATNDPKTVAAGIVQGFDAYYAEHDEAGIYTFSALDLSYMNAVRQALDEVVAQILASPTCTALLSQAHQQAPRFCLWPMYTDPVAFCKILESLYQQSGDAVADGLANALNTFYAAVEQSVVARCSGKTVCNDAYGFAIYLPAAYEVYESYPQTLFAQQSQWLALLNVLCGD